MTDSDRTLAHLLGIGIGVLVLLILLILFGPFAQVPNGQEGIVVRFGAATGSEFTPGLHFKLPVIESVVSYPTYPQRIDERGTTAATADLQNAQMDVVLNYQLAAGHILRIHRTLGPDYGHVIFDANVPALVKNATAQFTAQQLLHERSRVEQRALDLIAARVGSLTDGLLTVSAVSFNDVAFGRDYTQAIEKKVVAQQDLERAQIEASQRVVQAQGQARATLTLAGAQAAAQKLQQKSLTPLYVQYQALQRWNGRLPTYSAGLLPFIQLPQQGPPSGGR